jgi:hypothetical protein
MGGNDAIATESKTMAITKSFADANDIDLGALVRENLWAYTSVKTIRHGPPSVWVGCHLNRTKTASETWDVVKNGEST